MTVIANLGVCFDLPYGLLADFDRLSGAGRYMRTAGDPTLRWLLFFGVIGLAGVWGGLFLWDRWSRRLAGPTEQVDPMFVTLCQAHRLDKGARSLLRNVARESGVEPAAALFLDPTILRRWADGHPDDAETVAGLTEHLFGGEIADRAWAMGVDPSDADPSVVTQAG